MAHERYMPETTEAPGFNHPPNLTPCVGCGVHPAVCGRLINPRTGTVWPARDTGFRMGHLAVPKQVPTFPIPAKAAHAMARLHNFMEHDAPALAHVALKDIYLAYRDHINVALMGGARG